VGPVVSRDTPLCPARPVLAMNRRYDDHMRIEASAHPFRDELAAAVRRAERLARDNAALRAKLAVWRFDVFQWALVGIIVLCGIAATYVLTGSD
jgi:hypothetical protein